MGWLAVGGQVEVRGCRGGSKGQAKGWWCEVELEGTRAGLGGAGGLPTSLGSHSWNSRLLPVQRMQLLRASSWSSSRRNCHS